jgi:cell division protein FtsL
MVRKKIPRRYVLFGAAAFILILAILTFYLWHLTETARLGLAERDLEVQLARLRDEVRSLEAKKAALLSLERVEKVAREELHLTEPRTGQIVYEDGRDARR